MNINCVYIEKLPENINKHTHKIKRYCCLNASVLFWKSKGNIKKPKIVGKGRR